jgi:hypothetical protein
MTFTTNSLAAEQLIAAHPQAEQIRRVQRLAYQATSLRHRNGLMAASFLLGPIAPLGFSLVEEHCGQQLHACSEALEKLLASLGDGVADRRICALLLEEHPGRHPALARKLRNHLRSQA